MDIETAIFAKSKPDTQALLEYGFQEIEGAYHYEETFFNNEFKAVLLVSFGGGIEGHVYEIALNEEYAPLRIDSFGGGYVGSVREAYRELLKRIKTACFSSSVFVSPQANRIASLIDSRYGEKPDFPFEEDFGVFRYPENRKWYGLIMNLPLSKLTHVEDDERFADVMNMKVGDQNIEELLKRPGIYPAYHMNHQKWISVVFDESLNDEEVMNLIDASRRSVLPKKKTRS